MTATKTFYDYLVEALEQAHRDALENRHMQFTVYADTKTEAHAELTEEEAQELIFIAGDVAGGNSCPGWVYNSESMQRVKTYCRSNWVAEDIYEDYAEAVEALTNWITCEPEQEEDEETWEYLDRLKRNFPEAYGNFEKEAIEFECECTDCTFDAEIFLGL